MAAFQAKKRAERRKDRVEAQAERLKDLDAELRKLRRGSQGQRARSGGGGGRRPVSGRAGTTGSGKAAAAAAAAATGASGAAAQQLGKIGVAASEGGRCRMLADDQVIHDTEACRYPFD